MKKERKKRIRRQNEGGLKESEARKKRKWKRKWEMEGGTKIMKGRKT